MIMRIGVEKKIVPDDWKFINVSRCERRAVPSSGPCSRVEVGVDPFYKEIYQVASDENSPQTCLPSLILRGPCGPEQP